MLKNTKTSYIVPGYTGHLPRSAMKEQEIPEENPHGQIPGYCGYIESVKPENMFGKTHGNITYQINCETYHKGQDVGADIRYNSMARDTFINQSEVHQRTAANIVGVNPLPPNYRQPEGENVVKCDPMQRDLGNGHDEQNNGGTGYIAIDQTIPGYTGHARRIAADNIYGCTFKNAKMNAVQSQNRIDYERDENMGTVTGQIPVLGKSNH